MYKWRRWPYLFCEDAHVAQTKRNSSLGVTAMLDWEEGEIPCLRQAGLLRSVRGRRNDGIYVVGPECSGPGATPATEEQEKR